MLTWYILPLATPVILAALIAHFWGSPIALPKAIRFALVLAVALGAMRVYWYILSGGTVWHSNFGRTASIAIDVWYFTALSLVVLLACRGLVNIPAKLMGRGHPIDPSSITVALGMLGAAVLIAVTGVVNGYGLPQMTRITVPVRNLPAAAEGYRIAFLADTHICNITEKSHVAEIVRMVNDQTPDLVLLGGDYQDGRFDKIKDKLQELTKLQGLDGVYAVTGNHEGYGPDAPRYRALYEQGGFKFLDNANVTISDPKRGPLFNLAGVHDPVFGKIGARPDLALAGLTEGLPVFMLSHRPRLFDAVSDRVDLMLSGHTHGGSGPGLAQVIARMNHGYVAGEYVKDNGARLIVSRGVQQWMGWAFRLFNPNEIVLVTLKNARSTPAAETSPANTRQ